MQYSKLDRWLNLGAAMAVFLGLLLVAYEIQQANQVAFAEMRNEVNNDWINISTSAYSSDIGHLLQKASSEPNQLSNVEIFKLDMYYATMMQALHKQAVLYYEFGWAADPALYTNFYANSVYSSQFGRAWYLLTRDARHPKLIELLDHEIASLPINNDWYSVEQIRTKMESLSESSENN